MRMYFPDMMASMDLKKEVKRLDACSDLTVSAQQQPATPPAVVCPAEPAREARRDDHRRSREALRIARISIKPAKPFVRLCSKPIRSRCMRASYYGLARIAALQTEPGVGGTTVS